VAGEVNDYEVWFSNRPITFAGEVIDLKIGKGHYVRGGVTLCGRPVGGDRWERAGYATGHTVDCQRCLKAAS
jgi:hypothetical protein